MPRSATPVPTYFDAAARKLWAVTMRQLREQGTWEDSDAPILERYVATSERARLARERIAAWLAEHGDLLVKGYNGQQTQHPDLKTAREAEKDAQDYAEALLLTPGARKKFGITVGADADDPLA